MKNWFVFLFCFFMACTNIHKNIHQAQKGVLDLSNWNFEANSALNLDGEWEFYWQKLLYPVDFVHNQTDVIMAKVPTTWTNYKLKNGQNVTSNGFATYRIIVLLPEKYNKKLGLKIPPIWSASKIWINGYLVAERGNLEEKNYKSQIIGDLIEIPYYETRRLEIIVQAACYNFFLSGLIQSFKIGLYEELTHSKNITYTIWEMWIGVLFIMALYHFILYAFRRKNISTLYFGIICLLILARLVVFGDHYFYEILHFKVSFFTWIQPKIYYSATYALIPIALMYLKGLYETDIHEKILKYAQILIGFSCFFIIVLPVGYFFEYAFIPFQIILFCFLAYTVFVLLRVIYFKRFGFKLQSLGIFTMIFAAVNDGLHAQGIEIVGELELMPMAFSIFLTIQFIVIAIRFSLAFREVEDLSENLEKKVVERTEKIWEQAQEITAQRDALDKRSLELENAYKKITDSVRYASRIQQAILGDNRLLNELFADSFLLLMPKDIVSGDFYWFMQHQDQKILVAADCTGHGVPAAFMTILGRDFLEQIIREREITKPCEILTQLDKMILGVLQKQNNQQNEGMDIAVVWIEEKKQEILFSGAKNPIVYTQNGQIIEVKASKFPIGSSQFESKKYNTEQLPYLKNEMYYIFSDGFQDQFGGKENRKYLKRNFYNLLLDISKSDVLLQKARLQSEFEAWRADCKQTDDVLIVAWRL